MAEPETYLRTSTCAPLFAMRSAIARISWATCSSTKILTAVCADLGGDIFHDQGHPVPIKGDGCRTLLGFAVFADDALHTNQ